MSRIGKKVIEIPPNVEVKFFDNKVMVKGPKGSIEKKIPLGVSVKILDSTLKVELIDTKKKALWGTTRTIIYNMITGVTVGYKKTLIIEGQGYKASTQGNKLNLQVGYSHPIEFEFPEGIKIETPEAQRIIISGIDKELVGNTAAKIRQFKPPDPYKGKGIRYEGEIIRKKTMKKGTYGGTA